MHKILIEHGAGSIQHAACGMWHAAWVMGAYTRAAAADLRFDRPSGWAGQLAATTATTTTQRVPVVAKLTATAPGRDCVCVRVCVSTVRSLL